MAAPVVHAPCGPVVGIERPGSLAFLGIPYAAAPVGRLRFQAPEPPAPWREPRDATRFGATPQRRSPWAVSTIPEPSIPGEETLNLNVFTPDRSASLPVLVYIHGGGYIAGSHVGAWFDGATYNRDGVVVVTVSYRLGFDGFGWVTDAPANRGLRDLVCALEWVRNNIAAFGGDPSRVTISGQSAGGGAVLSLLAMPSARGLFRGAIAHSPLIGLATRAQHAATGRALASAAGVQPTIAGWSSRTEDEVLDAQFAFLAALDAAGPFIADLASAATAPCDVVRPLGPALDDATLAVVPHAAWARGFADDVALLIGATRDEFVRPDADLDAGQVRRLLDPIDLEPLLRTYLEQCIDAGDPDPLGRLATAVLFRRPVLETAQARTLGGARTWLYDFAHPSAVTGLAGHCLDLPFTWDALGAEGATTVLGDAPPQALADAMHGAWVAFVSDGDPGWPATGTRVQGRVFGGDGEALDDVRRLVRPTPSA